jgi:uncharacterized protein
LIGALITFAAAIAFCALVVWFGPGAAEQAIAWLGERAPTSDSGLDTLFSGIIFGALLLGALGGGALSRINPLRLGRAPVRLGLVGLAIGMGTLGVALLYAWIAGAVGRGDSAGTGAGLFVWGTLLILFATSVEEIYFRGWLQPVLEERFGTAAAVLMAALAFAALHVIGGARSPITLVNLFLGGLLFGLLAARGGGLAGAIGAHFGYNWSEQLLVGADPNPGVGSFGALMNLDLVGEPVWGGSTEGLNASVAMMLALISVVLPLLVLARTAPQPAGTRPLPGTKRGALGT